MMMGMKKGKTMMSSGKMETNESTRMQRIRSRDRKGQNVVGIELHTSQNCCSPWPANAWHVVILLPALIVFRIGLWLRNLPCSFG